RLAPGLPWAPAPRGLSAESRALPSGADGGRARRPGKSALPRLRPQRTRAPDSVVGAARARDATGAHRRDGANPGAQGTAAGAPRAALRRAGRGLGAPHLRDRHGGDLFETEGPVVRRAAPVRANALR